MYSFECVCETQLVTHGDRALSAITAPASLRRPLTIMLLLPWLQIHVPPHLHLERELWRNSIRREREDGKKDRETEINKERKIEINKKERKKERKKRVLF